MKQLPTTGVESVSGMHQPDMCAFVHESDRGEVVVSLGKWACDRRGIAWEGPRRELLRLTPREARALAVDLLRKADYCEQSADMLRDTPTEGNA